MLQKPDVLKAGLIGVVLLWLLINFSAPNVYFKLWFAILGAGVGIISIVRTEWKDGWLNGSILKLRPRTQFILIMVMVIAVLAATDWIPILMWLQQGPSAEVPRLLMRRNVFQWGATFWMLVPYHEGLKWAWSQLNSRIVSQS